MKSKWYKVNGSDVRVRFISRMCPWSDYGILTTRNEHEERRISRHDDGSTSTNEGDLAFMQSALNLWLADEQAEYAQWRIDNAHIFA